MRIKQSLSMMIYAAALVLGVVAQAHAEGFVYVDEPAGCFSKESYPCAVRALEALKLERGGDVYQFAADTSVVWIHADELRVLEGRFWIEKSTQLSLHLMGTDTVVVNGEFLVIREKDQNLVMMNLHGDVKFPAKGFLKSEALPVGFQNWYGRRMTEGNVERGVVRPIDVPTFMAAWARSGVAAKSARLEKVKEYKELWKDNVDQSSELYKNIVDRRIASQEDSAEAERRRQKKAEEERAKLRQMFREKNNLQ